MSSKIILLLIMAIIVKGSFLQTPNQFQSAFNSTFLSEKEKLFKPIIIPNVTNSTEQPPTTKVYEPKGNETVGRKIPNLKEISQEAVVRENYSDEEPKTTGNSFKFSSRYSTKLEGDGDSSKQDKPEEEKPREVESRIESTTADISKSEKNVVTSPTNPDRSGDLGVSDEKDDTSESREAEHSEIASTTNEPYSELQRPTSFRTTSYSDDDLDNYETTSTSAEETDSSEEKDEENKRSVEDYHNSDSKNYHSIQTPLKNVKYRGAHSYAFEPEKIRTRLLSPMTRHHDKPSWPYSRSKGKIDKLNEISDRDETYEKDEVEEEFRAKPKQLDLESAVEKDEFRFDRNKKYNLKEERNRRKQIQKALAAEEAKDEKIPLFQSLKQYLVEEEPRYKPTSRENIISKFKTEDGWSDKSAATTPKNTFKPTPKNIYKATTAKNIFKSTTHKNIFKPTTPKNIFKPTTPKNIYKETTRRKPQEFGASNELAHNYHGKHFLGPVVFSHNIEQPKTTPSRKYSTTQKVPTRSSYLKGLVEKEKLDQDNLTNQRSEKLILKTGNRHSQSFNHLEESDEMYNAILANIQSVFGIRTQSLKSTSQKGSDPEINLEESKSLTWSLPLNNRTKLV